MKYTKDEVERATDDMAALVSPGDTVYTVIRSVAKSGMSRTLSLFVVKDGKLRNVTWDVSRILGYPLSDVNGHRALRVNGAGMDMGFHVVYSLSHELFQRGSDGTDKGYALTQEWL